MYFFDFKPYAIVQELAELICCQEMVMTDGLTYFIEVMIGVLGFRDDDLAFRTEFGVRRAVIPKRPTVTCHSGEK